jgi:hypothetical protein
MHGASPTDQVDQPGPRKSNLSESRTRQGVYAPGPPARERPPLSLARKGRTRDQSGTHPLGAMIAMGPGRGEPASECPDPPSRARARTRDSDRAGRYPAPSRASMVVGLVAGGQRAFATDSNRNDDLCV